MRVGPDVAYALEKANQIGTNTSGPNNANKHGVMECRGMRGFAAGKHT